MRKFYYGFIGALVALGLSAPALAHERRWGDRHDRQHDRLERKHDRNHYRLERQHDRAHWYGLSRRQHHRLHHELDRRHDRADHRLEHRHDRQHRRDYRRW